MGVPKRRHSRSRQGMRRSHHRLALPTLVKCPQCKTLHVRHAICPECGHYRGRSIIAAPEEV